MRSHTERRGSLSDPREESYGGRQLALSESYLRRVIARTEASWDFASVFLEKVNSHKVGVTVRFRTEALDGLKGRRHLACVSGITWLVLPELRSSESYKAVGDKPTMER